MNIIFIAPPAAGKGTQSKMLSEKYNIPHISTGDLLRMESSSNTPLGLKIKSDMELGNLISDDIITTLLENRLVMEDCQNGFILDGYPRNVTQAGLYEELLNKLNISLGIVIFLDIDKNLALERTVSRIVCSKCGSSYNLLVSDLKPKVDGVCDRCGDGLKVRSDDNEETFLVRFDTYMSKTRDLIDYYENKGVLRKIDITSDKSALDVFKEVEEIINK